MAAPPNVMADVKDWLLNKCRDAGSLLSVERPVLHGGRHLSFNNVVVTPSNIPEFTIPDGSLSPPGKECSDTDSAGSSSGSNTCSSSSPHRYLYRQRPSYNHLLPAHQSCSKSRSAPVSPMRSMGERQSSVSDLVFSGVEGFCDEAGFVRHTNSDPMSLAALSLPYLKLQTKFGFETLSESPHTRRKESLFHVDGGSDDHSCEPASGLSFTCRHAKQKMPGSLEAEDADHRHMPITCRRNKRRHNVPAVIAPLGVVLTPNAHTSSMCDFALRSPYNHCVVTSFPSQMDLSPSDTHRYNTPGGSAHSAHQQSHAHHLRRASLREDASRSVRSSSSSAEVSPSVFRRHNSTQHLQMPQSEQELMDSACTVKAHSSATMSSEGLATSPCSSCRSVHSFPDLKEASIGEVRISLNYLPKLRQLKVGLLRIENLSRSSNGVPSCRSSQCRGSTDGGSLSTAMVTDQTDMLNSYVKLYLMPGKTQRQVSKVVRHSNNPVFNQDFVFNDVHRHQLKETRLHVKVCHKAPKLGRDEPLGQLQLPLDGLVPCQDTRFFRELDPPTSKHDLGYIHMSVCFHASAEKLTVSVTQVTDLARHTFTGAPDPYVRIELSQPRRTTLVQNTKTKKKNTAPVFNESFTFTISPKIDDLHDTKLTITVLDRSTLMSDGIIGQVRLGYGATEEAEFYHWNQVLQQPGRLATNWHMLMDPLDD